MLARSTIAVCSLSHAWRRSTSLTGRTAACVARFSGIHRSVLVLHDGVARAGVSLQPGAVKDRDMPTRVADQAGLLQVEGNFRHAFAAHGTTATPGVDPPPMNSGVPTPHSLRTHRDRRRRAVCQRRRKPVNSGAGFGDHQ